MDQKFLKMTDSQKALLKQLQLAGLGIVLMIFSAIVKEKAIFFVGLGVLVFGILRTIWISKIIKQLDED